MQLRAFLAQSPCCTKDPREIRFRHVIPVQVGTEGEVRAEALLRSSQFANG